MRRINIQSTHSLYSQKDMETLVFKVTEFKSDAWSDLGGRLEATMASEATKIGVKGNKHMDTRVINRLAVLFALWQLLPYSYCPEVVTISDNQCNGNLVNLFLEWTLQCIQGVLQNAAISGNGLAWSNGIVLWPNLMWACLWVRVKCFLMFLSVCGYVWVCNT